MNPTNSILLEGIGPGMLVAGMLLLLLPWIRRESAWRLLPIAIVLALTVRYLLWRVTVTIPPISDTTDFIVGCLFFAIECAAVTGSIISYITLTRTKQRSSEVDANSEWLASLEKPPLVDVFICTYNEEREILERTMLGATGMSHPNFRVWVLDDGRRPWLAELAAELKCNYLTRSDNAHAKAGNINNALRHVAALETPPDFISILDADFVPTAAFLTRALALFRDDSVGIVQTPQHFINPDPIQANLQASDTWPDEQRYFFDVLMPAKDAWGTAFCCGTSSVIRMVALAKVGGFATESVTEDYLLTLRLKRHGYQTVYLNERLSLGLAPEGIKEYITQRSRWCLGFMQIVRGADGPFKFGNGLHFLDRLSLVESLLYWSAAYLFRVAGILIPILYLLFDIHAVNVGTADGIANFVPYYLAQIAVMAWLSGQRVLPVMTDVSQLLAAREILTAVAIGLFRPKGQKFKVTAKGGDRSKTVIQWRMLITFAAFLGPDHSWHRGCVRRQRLAAGLQHGRALLVLVQHAHPDLGDCRLHRAAAAAPQRTPARRPPRHLDDRLADAPLRDCRHFAGRDAHSRPGTCRAGHRGRRSTGSGPLRRAHRAPLRPRFRDRDRTQLRRAGRHDPAGLLGRLSVRGGAHPPGRRRAQSAGAHLPVVPARQFGSGQDR